MHTLLIVKICLKFLTPAPYLVGLLGRDLALTLKGRLTFLGGVGGMTPIEVEPGPRPTPRAEHLVSS